MDFGLALFVVLVLVAIILLPSKNNKLHKNNNGNDEPDKKVLRPSFDYNGYLTQKEFDAIALNEIKKFRRIISYSIKGPVVRGKVRSVSKLSSWRFKIDFDDDGRFTGEYAIKSENYDSDIPEIIAGNIKANALSINYMKKNKAQFWTEKSTPKSIPVPISSRKCIGVHYSVVEKAFKDAGFRNILLVKKEGPNKTFDWNWLSKDELVCSVSIDGDDHYPLKSYVASVPIVITYIKYC